MNKSDQILAYITQRLETITETMPDVSVDTGFLSHYQDKLTQGRQVLVVQQLNDGPFEHKWPAGGKSTLNIVVGGLVAFDESAMTNLRNLLEATRKALFDGEDRQHIHKLNGLLSAPMKEAEPTPLIPPKEGQENAYFALPLELKYTEKSNP